MSAVAAKVFEIEAMGKTVCAVTGSGSSTLVTPKPAHRRHTVGHDPERDSRNAVFAHLVLDQSGERLEAGIASWRLRETRRGDGPLLSTRGRTSGRRLRGMVSSAADRADYTGDPDVWYAPR